MDAKTQQAEQRRYYERTAEIYDDMHVGEGDEHGRALDRIRATLDRIEAKSVLDVGSGTGRALRYLLDTAPHLELRGVEPVPALIEQAVTENGIPRDSIISGTGERLPFPDDSFDAVLVLGVLHHVPRPAVVVAELQRVARRGIFISDDNRFGRGPMPLGVLKLGLAKARLWPLVYRARTLGRGYTVTEGDGLAYSYSVYDSVHQFADWADELSIEATNAGRTASFFHPLLTASHVLLSATRDVR
jgi:ubiquinone/menaquinone biosynthesis C-methylase UbiE